MIRAMFATWVLGTIGMLIVGGCADMGGKVQETGKFIGGDSDAVVDCSQQQAAEASRQAIDDLQLIYINTDYKTADGGMRIVITARNRADEKLTVTISPKGSQAIVVVNTGPLSNTMLRDLALQDITFRLGLSTPQMLNHPDTMQSMQSIGGSF